MGGRGGARALLPQRKELGWGIFCHKKAQKEDRPYNPVPVLVVAFFGGKNLKTKPELFGSSFVFE